MFSSFTYYIRQYFGFSCGQTYGVVGLLALLSIALSIPSIIHFYHICEQKEGALQDAAVLDALVQDLEGANVGKEDDVLGSSSVKKIFFDINTACEGDLKRLYGVGSVRAKRIIAYRDRLGGFVDTMQYYEVYNLPADVVVGLQKHTFVKPHFVPQKIDINKASFKMLVHHPYITYSQAKAFIAYKDKYGVFDEVKDLEKVRCIDASVIQKLLPYVVVTN